MSPPRVSVDYASHIPTLLGSTCNAQDFQQHEGRRTSDTAITQIRQPAFAIKERLPPSPSAPQQTVCKRPHRPEDGRPVWPVANPEADRLFPPRLAVHDRPSFPTTEHIFSAPLLPKPSPRQPGRAEQWQDATQCRVSGLKPHRKPPIRQGGGGSRRSPSLQRVRSGRRGRSGTCPSVSASCRAAATG
jgi:hypothetical protein